MCLDYTTLLGDEEFFCGGESRAQGGRNGREWSRLKFFFFPAVPLNEILFGGGTQLGNIRTLTVVQKEQLLYICIYIYKFIFTVWTWSSEDSLCKELFSPLSFTLIFHLFSIFPDLKWKEKSLFCFVQFLRCGFNQHTTEVCGVVCFKTAAVCAEADVMGESRMLIEWAVGWSALKPESLPDFTLLNSAIPLCVCVVCVPGGCQRNWRRSHLSAWLGQVVRCQLAPKQLEFFSYYTFYSHYGLHRVMRTM